MKTSFELLQGLPLFADILKDGRECPSFVQDGREIFLESGERVVEEGCDEAAFYVVLEGRVQVLKQTAGTEMLVATHVPGSFFGELPLLLDVKFQASGRAEGPVRLWKLSETAFWQMLATCPSVTRQIMRTMAGRVQNIEALAQGHERLISLGTMAAGLSHELNNPAAGARHAARELKDTAKNFPSLACKLQKQNLGPELLDFIADLGRQAAERAGQEPDLTPMQRSDLEEEMGIWLEDHGVEDGYDLGATLLSAGLDLEWMECVLERVGEPALGAVMRYIAGAVSLNGSVAAIDEATRRISELVGAVKTFSHLDRSPVGEVNVKEGIDSTKLMLLHKLKRHKLVKEISPDLPPIWGYAGELNQVWTNLLDNAADAVEGMPDGCITIRAYLLNDCVAVDIEDNGPGIPPEVQKRLFEPFYTTKGVGKGTGLGLATAYGIVHGHHGGEIIVSSIPGKTVFHVCLPLDSIEALRQQRETREPVAA